LPAGFWDRLRGFVAALAGGNRHGFAALLGALAALALPPVGAIPLLAVAFTGLVWLIDASARPRAAFAAGWFFGVGFFVAGLYWIGIALLVDVARFGWMIPFAVGGLAAVLALYAGLAAVVAYLAAPAGAGRVAALAVAWAAAEWLRGVLLTGFPWNPIGSVWAVLPAMMQAASVAGVYGLGLLTVAVAASPAAGRGRTAWRWAGAALLLLALLWSAGALRLAAAPSGTVPGVTLRLVQPDIPQAIKWREDLAAAHFARLLALSTAPAAGLTAGPAPTHIVWPETATPYFLAADAARRHAIAGAVPPGGLVITGSVRIERDAGAGTRIWNSLHAIDGAGAVRATYDKAHLVPFGEYVPFRAVLDVAKVTPGAIDFTPGPGTVTLALPGLPPASPLICYEVIFPGAVARRDARPGWLLNLTNDAWYGRSSGPYQHFVTAQFRAVEEGLPVVRAANNGISGVIDAHGRVVARLGLARRGHLDAALPLALAAPTVYARIGDWPLGALVALVLGLALRRRARLRAHP